MGGDEDGQGKDTEKETAGIWKVLRKNLKPDYQSSSRDVLIREGTMKKSQNRGQTQTPIYLQIVENLLDQIETNYQFHIQDYLGLYLHLQLYVILVHLF